MVPPRRLGWNHPHIELPAEHACHPELILSQAVDDGVFKQNTLDPVRLFFVEDRASLVVASRSSHASILSKSEWTVKYICLEFHDYGTVAENALTAP